MLPQFIMTVQNDGDVAAAIADTPAEMGYVSSLRNISKTPFFLDYPFTDPNSTFDDHLAAAKRLNPKLAVAPDIEKSVSLSDGLYQAELLSDHAETVIVVPKSVHPSKIPQKFRVGLTMANFGSSAPWTLWDYRDCKSIHILGGPPHRQMVALEHGLSVDSMDSFTLGIQAMYGVWDGKKKDAPSDWDYRRRVTESILNYCRILESL